MYSLEDLVIEAVLGFEISTMKKVLLKLSEKDELIWVKHHPDRQTEHVEFFKDSLLKFADGNEGFITPEIVSIIHDGSVDNTTVCDNVGKKYDLQCIAKESIEDFLDQFN